MELARENDIDILRSKAVLLQRENERLHERLAELGAKIDKMQGKDAATLQQQILLLTEQLAASDRREFGPSSERRPKPGAAKPEKKRTGHGRTKQPDLPIEDEVHELADAQPCDKCGGELVPMGEQFEDSEEITRVERRFVIKRHRRRKYRCSCGECVVTAPGPVKLVAGGRYSIDFAVGVALEKYLWHMPLARQQRQMATAGLRTKRHTLWDQIDKLAEYLDPSWRALRGYVRRSPVVCVDETTWPMLERGSKKWWAWAMGRPDAVYYDVRRSRSHQMAEKLVGDYFGVVLTDGYVAYETLRTKMASANGGDTFTAAACWAHVRRAFVVAEPSYPEAAEAIGLIGTLFEVEREVDTADFAHPLDRLRERARRRNTDSRAALVALKDWRKVQSYLPKSSLGKAVRYMDGLGRKLEVFLDDPNVPLSNNQIERGIRGPAVGRRNHFGSKSMRGTEVAACFYSLVETCKLVDVPAAEYLAEAARRAIAEPGTITLPHHYKAQR
jgi:transposase